MAHIMFIRKVPHKDKKTGKKYHTYKLVESVRTQRGPRQRDALNLGAEFDLPRDQWKDLANCIESIITGQQQLFDYPKEICKMARKYAKRIIRQQYGPLAAEADVSADYQSVDVNSVDNEDARTVGAEYAVYETIRELGIDRKLRSFGLNDRQLSVALGVIAGRLIAPGSERATHHWMQKLSALDELIGVDFSGISLDSVYKASDRLLVNKDALEEHLAGTASRLFGLQDKIILYDLSNTFFEGSGKYNPKARYGNSKEKRSDCLLVTLALVLDMRGFPKRSRIYEGNIGEPKTLEAMVGELSGKDTSKNPLFKPTIVLDAGIATEDNIRWLRAERYAYIVVSRKKKKAIPSEVTLIAVKRDEKRDMTLVEAGFFDNQQSDELQLYCRSVDKEKKEEGIKNRFEQRYEAELLTACKALSLKHGTKQYAKVLERIGRLKERYRLVSRGYRVKVEKDDQSGNASNITWSRKKAQKTSGVYCLRTNRRDLNEQEIWDIYTMLTDIEDAFRCMKSELGLRPIYHQKERRCDGHLFITTIAYHVMHTIRYKLRHSEIALCWATIRKQLSTQIRITTTMKRKDHKVVRVRKSSRAEASHQVIYDALGLPHQPGKTVKAIL